MWAFLDIVQEENLVDRMENLDDKVSFHVYTHKLLGFSCVVCVSLLILLKKSSLNVSSIEKQVHSRIISLTAVNGELDDVTRRREAALQWATELKGTINDLRQRKARLRPEAAQHDINQVKSSMNIF